MNKINPQDGLRRRAEEILASRNQHLPSPDQTIYQLVEELNLHQIELELQNESLINAQQNLQVSHDKFADLYNLAPVGYFTLNADGLIIDVNQSGLDLLAMKRNSVINRCFSLYLTPEFQMLFSQVRRNLQSTKAVHSCEVKMVKWSGPSFDVQLECKSIRDTNDMYDQCLICMADISSRKIAEHVMQLQRVKISAIDRVRSMSEQVYSLTRNQNHCLAIMTNYISGCIRRLESGKFNAAELINSLQKVVAQSSGLSQMIQQVRNLTSKSVLRYENSNINTIISDSLSLILDESPDYPVVIQYEKTDSLPSVKVDKLHIQQVILSLARNAIEAMSDAKTIQPKLLIEARLVNNNEIIVSLLDNGPGLDLIAVQKIFDVNYTTKSYALGLGLATSRTIIEKHGGQLSAHVNSCGGASFQFTLPCAVAAS